MVYSVIFDLLPVRMPDVFPPGADQIHAQWLQTAANFDGAICISKAVADDFVAWQEEVGFDWQNRRPFRVGWFHLGADVANSAPSLGLPDNAEWLLGQLRNRPSFLMVGTIEPRKGYMQTVEAFSQLWRKGVEVNLVVVGREGWQGLPDDMRRDIPQTTACLRTHPELNKRLFWLDGVSDSYLEKVYAASTCLIAASYGEGFGLPLIEAAQHKLPIIARDIPVFREVAREYARYFSGSNGAVLANAVKDWLDIYAEKRAPLFEEMPFLTWKQSAERIMQFCISDAAPQSIN
jgi:glycosyltransferase involved in cell wall biosynthesis